MAGLESRLAVLADELDKAGGEVLLDADVEEDGCARSGVEGAGFSEMEIRQAAEECAADVSRVSMKSVLVRQRQSCMYDEVERTSSGATTHHGVIEVRVAVVGNVDSGKSTLVGCLTRLVLDDGRGLARSKVFRHAHEAETGRTSSVAQHTLCLDSKGNTLNAEAHSAVGGRLAAEREAVKRAAKVVTLVDLAGHEKYFKTTAYGLTGYLPDYACVLVGGNAGITGMCKEHLGVALALKVPVFFVITKIDIAPEHVLKRTIDQINAILRKPGVKKKAFMCRSEEDVVAAAKAMPGGGVAPVLQTSAVTGEGLNLVRLLYNLLPTRQRWADRVGEKVEFVIDEVFSVPGVGTVVSGTVTKGRIVVSASGKEQQSLVLGPAVGDGSFNTTSVKSIHYKRLPVLEVRAGQTAALALKKVKRNAVRKGMVLLEDDRRTTPPEATWEFDAEIAILTHSTTIQERYQAVIHCEIVRQPAKVVRMNKERLRSGDRASVRFRFLLRPEYLHKGARFVFREGKTKGIGLIVECVGDGKTTDGLPASSTNGTAAASENGGNGDAHASSS